ncbi:protein kinase C-binding protein NELL2 [Protopterus annectens]|uniref:protein kinase C-binding protein NELL2 n=1 Tax=Protopterus annectens TaxID=7888 RepID=UPI001CFA72C3|nr:protein kinase C-binding protein NELL2 [Protopterus annectens]
MLCCIFVCVCFYFRYLELESSGHRNEVRLHYRKGSHQSHTEIFPYTLADEQWHRLSLGVSSSHVILHVDCNKIYERIIEKPFMAIPTGATLWLGQRNNIHGYFKGIMQDVQLLVMPQGYILQCPDLNRTCPTCNDFHGLVQKIMELQDILAKTSAKLSRAEEKMNGLDQCYCERTCTVKGVVYREFESWTDGCKNCTCMNGTVHCETLLCPDLQCDSNASPVYIEGRCCQECRPKCVSGQTYLLDGEKIALHISADECIEQQCQNGVMGRVIPNCHELNCPSSQQITLSNSCCKICQGHDFCAEGHSCMENSICKNLEDKAVCSCRDGFRPLRGDQAYCEDIDECAEGHRYCHDNTMCVNTPGSFMCICKLGYIRIDDYSCTEHDECCTGQHNCDENAVCLNTVGGHNCVCKPGYSGNGTICKAFCEEGCKNGGTCISPNVCVCPQGFTGHNCQTDIDECLEGFVQCDDNRATCINLPGWYHCECRDGYRDNGMFTPNGDSCEDIDECKTGRHSCTNDTVCFNLDGTYDCRCPHGKNCTGDCVYENKIKHDGQIWVLENDKCSVCSCQKGLVMCRRMVCDCQNPTVDLFCCPECDSRLTSHCLHQNGDLVYSSGETWIQNCQQCRCLHGEVDCWPLPCPDAEYEFSVIPEGECCPRSVKDPCQADTIRNDITKTCLDEQNVIRFTGSSWIKQGTECTLCQCKNGHICCSVDPQCLQEL